MISNRSGLTGIGEEMGRLVEGFFGPTWGRQLGLPHAFPALNAWEDGDDVWVEAELPGFQSQQLDISVEGQELTIRGQRDESLDEGASYYRRERMTGQFARTIVLPSDIDAEKVEASLQDGVLRIKLPKASVARRRRVEVTTNTNKS